LDRGVLASGNNKGEIFIHKPDNSNLSSWIKES